MMYCRSSFKNNFCKLEENWQNATCNLEEMGCSIRARRHEKCVFHFILANKFGQTCNRSYMGLSQKYCIGGLVYSTALWRNLGNSTKGCQFWNAS